MAAITLDGDTLGEKHKHYNRLLKEASENKESIDYAGLQENQNDIKILLNIDTACHKKDVEYIIKVLESEDMLYVSRAIQNSTWLLTEKQYAHIINPEYLRSQLFPRMSTKASNKLLQHIRLHLRDEARVEQFYQREKSPEKALKWLPHCSAHFIEKNIDKHIANLNPQIFKRLCEKSFTVFETVMKKDPNQTLLNVSKFLLINNIDKYLDVIEQLPLYYVFKLGTRATSFVMKNSPDRIIDKFEHYQYIDMPTFAKHIKKEDIEGFLYKLADKILTDKFRNLNKFFRFNKIIHLIKRIPEHDRFEFVKKVFIDKINPSETAQETRNDPNSEMSGIEKLQQVVTLKKYIWYQFAPFDIAFTEIKKLIQSESSHSEKYAMLTFLITCAAENAEHLYTLLQYYSDNQKNDDFSYQYQFVSSVIERVDIHKFEQKSWQIINEIFKNMDVYTKSDNNIQVCLQFIIVYNILQNAEVPEIIEKQFSFVTLKTYHNKLNKDEKEKVFSFLYKNLLTKMQNQNVTNKKEFNETKLILENVLALLLDWNKNILDYPFALNKIKDLIKINSENSWKISLSSLYNVKKSWRKHMFEESILLRPSEEVCMNALKHDPGLLMRYEKEVEAMCSNDALSLQRVLSKLRIYWPYTLAADWSDAYLKRLGTLGGHKALVRGLCALLPQKPLMDIIQTYAPKESKIDWSKTDELTLSLQKHVAKNMHLARPQPTPDAVLWYAKGDYLQYAHPSILAIFYNLNTIATREQIPKLLDAPVSLQKHGIRFAFVKLESEELKDLFLNIWRKSKNASIRCVIFTFTFKLLCDEEDSKRIESFWQLLELFIDNLSYEEDEKIYNLLSEVNKVPLSVRANFLMKSYKFLERLIPHMTNDRRRYEWFLKSVAEDSRDLMQFMCPEFVSEIILRFIEENFFNFGNEYGSIIRASDGMIAVITAYLLSAKDLESQTQRYKKILLPLIQRSFSMWDETHNGNYFIRQHFQELLEALRHDLKEYVIKNNCIIPYKMYSDIQNEMKALLVSENYTMLTMWNITTAFAKLLQKHNVTGEWSDICSQISPEFEEMCVAYLKEDVKTYFPCIYVIYSEALQKSITDLPENGRLTLFRHMLSHKDFVQAYLVTIQLLASYHNSEEGEKEAVELKKLIFAHPSVEVKMHYYSKFNEESKVDPWIGGYYYK